MTAARSRLAIVEPPANGGQASARIYLEGACEIAIFLRRELGSEHWTERRVRHARNTGALPIRQKSGIGLYAFGDELLAAFKDPATLPGQTVG